MTDRVELLFGASHDPGEVAASLSSRYTVIAEPRTVERWTCLDTADWRLYRAGMTLRDRRRADSDDLVLLVNGGERVTAPSDAGRWPRRIADLAGSAVRDRIATIVGVRALMAMVEVESRVVRLRLLDDVAKTRALIQIHQQRLTNGNRSPLALRVAVLPLRGYERDGSRCRQLLTTAMPALDDGTDAVSAALVAAGRRPGSAPPKSHGIDPRAPAVRSVAAALLSLLDVMDRNRLGVIDDVDTEFLHDVRTAARATRSILSLTGDVLPSGSVDHFAAEFRWLGRITARVRDLDVHLLELHGMGGVDTEGLDDLEPLHEHLARQRRPAMRALRTALTSPRTMALSRDWRQLLESAAVSEVAGPATAEIAAARAQLAYRRIRKAAARISSETPPDELHALRRRCKAMRYLLESFSTAYDPAAYQTVTAHLRKLQSRLGDIQDGEVQQLFLHEAANALSGRDGSLETVLAIGAVRDRITRHAAVARVELDAPLARFCGRSIRTSVASLECTEK